MKRRVYLFALLILIINISGTAASSVLEYDPVYVDSVLSTFMPQADLLSDPGLHPEQIAGKYRFDIQPVVIHSNKSLVFVVFLVCLAIFLLVKFLYPDYYAASVEGFFNLSFFTQLFRSNEYGEIIPFVLMAVFRCMILSLAMLLVLVVLTADGNIALPKYYFLLLSLTTLTVIVKSVAEYLFNFFAGSLQTAGVYFVQVTILFNVMSLILLPILLVLFYQHQVQPQLVYGLLLGWMFVSSLFYLFRSVQVLPARGFIYYMHFLLYICAFEIIPWMLLLRIVWNVTG